MKKIGIICTWPWGLVNAESEVTCRMKEAARNINVELIPITKDGYLVDSKFNKTKDRVNEKDLDFVITMRYEDVKMLDVFHYHAVWNPPNIFLQYDAYPIYARNIATNDDFLAYDDGGMKEYFHSLVGENTLDFENVSSLTASFPKTMMIPPKLPENISLFYCGNNWERFLKKELRHKGLFSLLDNQPYMNLYGPKGSWVGYKAFKGTIPFDGISLVREIHKCGAMLALTSGYHYRAGAATNRIYEACAAGAVTITDTNRFIKKHWKDSVLYIDYDPKNPAQMFKQIDGHIKWIASHRKEAEGMALQAQEICKNEFSLEKQLTDIINNHPARQKSVAKAYYAQNEKEKVLAVLFLDSPIYDEKTESVLRLGIENIEKQIYKNITLAVLCENSIYDKVETVTRNYTWIKLIRISFYDSLSNKELSRAQAFYSVKDKLPHDYLIFLSGNAELFSTHITQLKRALEDNQEVIAAYSAICLNTENTKNSVGGLYETNTELRIFKLCMNEDIYAPFDIFLMKSEIANMPESTHRYIDNLLPNALLCMAIYKNKQELKYLPKISCRQTAKNIEFPNVSDNYYQTNFIKGLIADSHPIGYDFAKSVKTLEGKSIKRAIHLARKILKIQIKLHKILLSFTISPSKKKKRKARIETWEKELKE